MKYVLSTIFSLLLLADVCAQSFHLIAHRGGVVGPGKSENSLAALKAAIDEGYWMVEVDLRITKDQVFILYHNKTFRNGFGIDKSASEMTWKEVQGLRHDQSDILSLEKALATCKSKMQIMIDNKVNGNDTIMFARVVHLLQKYDLLDQALMIGTDESTDFFTGKIKLSCTRQQLELNKTKREYKPANYFLFGGTDSMAQEDVAWAQQQGILVVGVVNRFRYQKLPDPEAAIDQDVKTLKSWGVTHFQIDAEFSRYFR